MTEIDKEKIVKEQGELFKKLTSTNCNEHTEAKNGLTYLSWSWAWQLFKETCPDATYEIEKFTNPITGVTLPYIETEIGYMVFTKVTACGQTYEMWLPAMDNTNKTLKKVAYDCKNRTVDACTMFDINKTIMRCLTKNLAMFGLGLYIYAGEDLPVEVKEKCTPLQVETMRKLKVVESSVCSKFKIKSIEELTFEQADWVIATKQKALANKGE